MASQVENEIEFLEKEDYNIEGLKQKYKQFLKENTIIMILQQSFKIDHHDILTVQINISSIKQWRRSKDCYL